MIVLVSNFLNHHQFPLAKNLFELTKGEFIFIETTPMPEIFKKTGYIQKENPSWLLKAWEDAHNENLSIDLIRNSEVVIIPPNYFPKLIKERLKNNLLTFEVGERWLKKGLLNLLSPNLIKSQINYHLFFYNKPYYRLNASAFAANDMKLLHSFKNKMFKWGYFTEVTDCANIDKFNQNTGKNKIIWIGRFIKWKHPEVPVMLGEYLSKKGYEFEISMYGNGPLFNHIEALIDKKNLKKFVKLKGNLDNHLILRELKNSHVCICTSDRNEGWGAVVNEAMATKCVVIASDEMGAVPFLIEDGVNGLIYRKGSIKDLAFKVEKVILDINLSKVLANNAFNTISKTWSPFNAAQNLLNLIRALNESYDIIENGPASPDRR